MEHHHHQQQHSQKQQQQTNNTSKRTNYSPIAGNTIKRVTQSGSNSAQVSKFIDSTSEEEENHHRKPSASIEDLNEKHYRRQKWQNLQADYDSRPCNYHKESRDNNTTTLAKERHSDDSDNNVPYCHGNWPSMRDQSHQFVDEERGNNELLQQQPPLEEDENIDSDLEEVYLCNRCGITKELKPAMKYLPTFQSLFYLFNFLSFIFAFALLGFGIWYRIDPKVYELHKYIETQNFTIAGWIMLFGGFLVCLLTLACCRSVSKQQLGSLLFYCILMTIITLAFIGSLVLLTVHGLGSKLERFMSKEIYDQVRRRVMSSELDLYSGSDSIQFLDFVQVKLRCCGAIDFRDYQKLGTVVPVTCYSFEGNHINAPGCAQAIRELFDLRAGLAAGFTAAGVVCQLLAIIFAALIICSIYNHRANPPRPPSVSSIKSSRFEPAKNIVIKTPSPAQFDKMATTARARDYEARPSSRSSLASIRV